LFRYCLQPLVKRLSAVSIIRSMHMCSPVIAGTVYSLCCKS
jgi:hypothetical protein